MLRKLLITLTMLCSAVGFAQAESYPCSTITLVTPFAAGSPQDLVARTLASGLEKELRRTMVVKNQISAYGVPTVKMLKDERSDGCTLVHGHDGQFGIMVAVYNEMNRRLASGVPKYESGYDPISDFTPIGTFAQYSFFVTANKGLGIHDVASLRMYGKAHPALNIGAATGPSSIILSGMLKQALDLTAAETPRYRSDTDAMQDMLAGRVDLFAATTNMVLGQGDAIALVGTVGKKRSSFYPELPTLAEQGLQSFALVPDTWTGLFCPGRCPSEVTAQLALALKTVSDDPGIRERLRAVGVGVNYHSAAEVPSIIAETIKAHEELIAATGVEVIGGAR